MARKLSLFSCYLNGASNILMLLIFVITTIVISRGDDILLSSADITSTNNNNSSNNDDNNKIQEDTYYMHMGIRIYKIDRECAMLGGLCVQKSDCLQTTSKSGLCPTYQANGIECCYELSTERQYVSVSVPCSQHSGICTSQCNELLKRPATDCPQNQFCCVLI